MGKIVSKSKLTSAMINQKIVSILETSRTDASIAVAPVISQSLSQYSRLLDFADFSWSTHRLMAFTNFPEYSALFIKWSVGAYLAIWAYVSCIYFTYNIVQPTVIESVGELIATLNLTLSASGQQDVIAFTTFIFSIIGGGTMGSILVGTYHYLKGYLSTRTRYLRTSQRRNIYDLFAITILIFLGGIPLSLLLGFDVATIYHSLFTGLGIVLLFSSGLSMLVFWFFPHFGARILELLGFWRVNEQERMSLLREVIKYLEDKQYTGDEINAFSELAKYDINQHTHASGRMDISIGLIGTIVAVIAITVDMRASITMKVGETETGFPLYMLFFPIMMILLSWYSLNLKFSQGKSYQVLSLVIQACNMMKFELAGNKPGTVVTHGS